MRKLIAFIFIFVSINCLAAQEDDLSPEQAAKELFELAGGVNVGDGLDKKSQEDGLVQDLEKQKNEENLSDGSGRFVGISAMDLNYTTPRSDKEFDAFSQAQNSAINLQGTEARSKAIKDIKDPDNDNPMADVYKDYLQGPKYSLPNDDHQLIPAIQAKDESVLKSFSEASILDGIPGEMQDITIHTCYESVHKSHQSCSLHLNVPVSCKEPEDKLVTLYAATNTYDGHGVAANLISGAVSMGGSVHPGTKIDNPLGSLPEGTTITPLGKTINARFWDEIGVHHFEVYYNRGQEPSASNGYVYTYSVSQGAMGRKKKRRENGDKFRGFVDQWKYRLTYSPKIAGPDQWLGCSDYDVLTQRGQCSLISEECSEGSKTKKVNGLNITRDCWASLRTYKCKFRDDGSECDRFKTSDCRQVESVCQEYEQGVCVLYKQIYECGGRGTATMSQGFQNVLKTEAKPLEYTPNNDFGQSIAALKMASLLGQEMVDGKVTQIFRGTEKACRSRPEECCADKGGWKKLVGCSDEEQTLVDQYNKGLCYFVEEGRIKEKLRDKAFKGWQKKWCCFQSKLAKIIQVGVRKQLGIDWGNFESPNCRALSFAELEDPRIDWGKIDFSKLESELAEKARAMNRPDFVDLLKVKLDQAVGAASNPSVAQQNVANKVMDYPQAENDVSTQISEFLGEVRR